MFLSPTPWATQRCVGVPGCRRNWFEVLWRCPEGGFEQYTFLSATALARWSAVTVPEGLLCSLHRCSGFFDFFENCQLGGPRIHPPPWRALVPLPETSKTQVFVLIMFSVPFGIDVCSTLARLCLPTCLPGYPQIDEKTVPRGTPSRTSSFDRFLIDSAPNYEPPNPKNNLTFFNLRKCHYRPATKNFNI